MLLRFPWFGDAGEVRIEVDVTDVDVTDGPVFTLSPIFEALYAKVVAFFLPSAEEVVRMRGDLHRALQEAAMIRSHLHVILSRLPEPPEGADELHSESMAA